MTWLMNRFARVSLAFSALTAVFTAAPASAQVYTQAGFEEYLQQVGNRARAEGVSARSVANGLSGLTINDRVVELDRPQAPDPVGTPFPPFAPYRARHVDSARINGGRNTYAASASVLPQIEQRYGVPGQILIAIWGHETNYGSYTGSFDTIRSLATLAYEGRRRELFEGELIAALKMMDQGVTRQQLTGSWAGAIGNPQFLPSVWLRVAADGDGNGTRDIWSSRADTLASIANYFVDAGWRRGEPWGVPAYVPSGYNRSADNTKLSAPRCERVFERHSQWKTIREWKALGVVPQKPIGDDAMAFLFEPDGPGQPAYLLTSNYRVILDYNCSNYYALSVGLLADAIR
ncbi:lytic murein transglycosylase [Croceicoccus mobilis]|nr:lytic murein transglycosylase [Croceicoccus mobilis]